MKDQYVGDVNDYAKYQLLRICREHFDEVLIAWMLTPADERSDGLRLGYLEDEAMRDLDPPLFDELAAIVAAGARRLAAIEASEALRGCGFIDRAMPSSESERRAYFEQVAERANPDSLVFFDPDNGLEIASVARHRSGSERFLYWRELDAVRERGASVMVYQHFPRVQRGTYVQEKLAKLGEEMGADYEVFAAHSSQVAFLFAVRGEAASGLGAAVAERCSRAAVLTFTPGAATPRG